MRIDAREEFIPGTCEREIAPGIVFRPKKSWHSGTWAGERLRECPHDKDSSGCVRTMRDEFGPADVCRPPLTVTHRFYWNKARPEEVISAFLSYPNGMGAEDGYFWEIYPGADGDEQRFETEEEMEKAIVEILSPGEEER